MQEHLAGKDIGDAFVPQESFVHWLVGGILFKKPYEASKSTGAWKSVIGFRDELTKGGQNDDVYRHIAAGASLGLREGFPIILVGDLEDIRQGIFDGDNFFDGDVRPTKGGWDQRFAELNGNHAGALTGLILMGYLEEMIDKNTTREAMRNALCK